MSEYVDDEGRREPRVGRTVSNQPISTGNEAPMPSAARAAAATRSRRSSLRQALIPADSTSPTCSR